MYYGNIAASIGMLSAFQRVPVIWSIHHSLYDITTEKPLTRSLIRLAAILSSKVSAIAYCSGVAADQHEAMGFDPRRRAVIYNGIDCNEFKPPPNGRQPLPSWLPVPAGRCVIGSVGRWHPMKNQAGLLLAVAALVRQGYDLHCIFVGPGHENGELVRHARKLEIADRISVTGTEANIPNFMKSIDIHAISSAWGGAFSIATAEAMASGLPTMVTDVGDCPFVVGDTGLVAARKDPDALAAAIRQLVDMSPDARARMGRNARRRVIENFSLDQHVARHLALYEEVMARRALDS